MNKTFQEALNKIKELETKLKAKDEEFNKILDKFEDDAWMYADMDEEEFWSTSNITPKEAVLRANVTRDIVKEIKQRRKEE